MNPRGDGVRIEPFERLYDAYFRDIAAYVVRRAAAQDVEDVVAKVFAIAWRRFERIPPPPDDRLWLFGVARHCLNDLRRGEARQHRLHTRLTQERPVASTVSSSSGADPRLELLLSAIASLAPTDREALQLVLWEELTHTEAATVLGCTPNAFELRYRRARQAVKAAVESSAFPSTVTFSTIEKRSDIKGVPQ